MRLLCTANALEKMLSEQAEWIDTCVCFAWSNDPSNCSSSHIVLSDEQTNNMRSSIHNTHTYWAVLPDFYAVQYFINKFFFFLSFIVDCLLFERYVRHKHIMELDKQMPRSLRNSHKYLSLSVSLFRSFSLIKVARIECAMSE